MIESVKGNTIVIEKNGAINGAIDKSSLLLDHNYNIPPVFKNVDQTYLKEVIAYISGFVANKVYTSTKCICKELLISDKAQQYSLQEIKNRGKLTFASSDVIQICLIAEQIIKEIKVFELEDVKKILLKKAMKKISSWVLDNKENCLENHRTLLITNILNKFFEIRLHYESTQEFPEEIRIRAKNTKVILFKNQ